MSCKTTIGIPVYNEVRFIRHTLNSALGQADQIVISDNASTDGTTEICREFAEKYPEITYFRQETTVDVLCNFLQCLLLAEHEYFMFLGGHDLLSQNYVRELKKILDADEAQDAILAYGNSVFLNAEYHFEGVYRYEFAELLALPSVQERVLCIARDLTVCSLYNGLFRKEALIASMDEAIRRNKCGIDHGVLACAALRGRMLLCPNVTLFRVTPRPAEGGALNTWSRVLQALYLGVYDPEVHVPELIPAGIAEVQFHVAMQAAVHAPDPQAYLMDVGTILLQRWSENEVATAGIVEATRRCLEAARQG